MPTWFGYLEEGLLYIYMYHIISCMPGTTISHHVFCFVFFYSWLVSGFGQCLLHIPFPPSVLLLFSQHCFRCTPCKLLTRHNQISYLSIWVAIQFSLWFARFYFKPHHPVLILLFANWRDSKSLLCAWARHYFKPHHTLPASFCYLSTIEQMFSADF